jgi:hypothetical protein
MKHTFFRTKKKNEYTDGETKGSTLPGRPVMRCSICTGEKVAGFLSEKDGHFQEVRLIRNSDDLLLFCHEYGITEEDIPKIY